MTIRTLAISTLCASVLTLMGCQSPMQNQPHHHNQQAHPHNQHQNMMQSNHAKHHANHHSKANHAHTAAYHQGMQKMHDDMMQGMQANDADVAFAKGMLPHHVGAIDMAEVQLKYGKDTKMRQLAQDIMDAQKREIQQMQRWLNAHPDTKKQSYTDAMHKAYKDGMEPMHKDMMSGIAHPNPDMAFAKGMLPHHEGAVAMAKVQLKYGKDQEMLKLAREIIEAQESEIQFMQNWIDNHQ